MGDLVDAYLTLIRYKDMDENILEETHGSNILEGERIDPYDIRLTGPGIASPNNLPVLPEWHEQVTMSSLPHSAHTAYSYFNGANSSDQELIVINVFGLDNGPVPDEIIIPSLMYLDFITSLIEINVTLTPGSDPVEIFVNGVLMHITSLDVTPIG